jgi:hypothetical protein
MLEAENDKAALECFVKKVDSGDVTENEGAGFHDPNIFLLTFEEVDRDGTTKVDILTTDMKWMDIEIKELKTKINDQSVEDAKKGLLDIAS